MLIFHIGRVYHCANKNHSWRQRLVYYALLFAKIIRVTSDLSIARLGRNLSKIENFLWISAPYFKAENDLTSLLLSLYPIIHGLLRFTVKFERRVKSISCPYKILYTCIITFRLSSINPAGTWHKYNVASTSMQRPDDASTLRRRYIIWRKYNVASTSEGKQKRHDVASTLRRRYNFVMCPLGISLFEKVFDIFACKWTVWSLPTAQMLIIRSWSSCSHISRVMTKQVRPGMRSCAVFLGL